MTDHLKAHGKQMLIAGAAVMVVAAVLGAGWRQAVTWGLLLACPVGMLAMMRVMGRQMAGGPSSGGHHDGAGTEHAGCHGHASGVPEQRLSEAVVPEPRPGA